MGRVALHESLTLAVGEVPALAARALGDQYPRAVNAGRMELDELHVLERQTGPQDHRIAIAGAGVRRSRGEIATAVAAGRNDHRLGAETMDRAVIEVERDHAAAGPVFHDQVEREIFDEEVGVVLEALLVERVEHRVTGTVGGGAGALGRRALPHVLGHSAECALVNFALGGAAERQAGMLELDYRRRRFAAQIFDRVLVAEPVGALDRIVHVPGPMVRAHVAECSGDSALGCNRMAAGREDLGDAGGLKSLLGGAHRRAKARAPGANHNHVISVVDDLICAQPATPNAMRASANSASAPPPTARNSSKVLTAKLLPGSWT